MYRVLRDLLEALVTLDHRVTLVLPDLKDLRVLLDLLVCKVSQGNKVQEDLRDLPVLPDRKVKRETPDLRVSLGHKVPLVLRVSLALLGLLDRRDLLEILDLR